MSDDTAAREDLVPPLPQGRQHLGRLVTIVAVFLSLLHIYFNTLATLPENWISALHFGGLAFLGALTLPLFQANGPAIRRLVLGIDVVIGTLALICACYLILFENALYDRGQAFIWSDWLVSIIAILLAIEFARRTTGWIIPVLIIISLTYVAWWGRYVPGMFTFPGLSWENVLFRSYFAEGMFGLIARISSTFVFMFILFGAFLLRSGAGAFIVDMARAVAGRFIGGPGLVAVLGSGLMGSISGSAVANTVSTGVITIPLMKRAGFSSKFAAGVEASASTGGQLMPPIMGAGVFIMASYTQISYLTIVGVAFLPAVMYFLSIAFWVRIEAKKQQVQLIEDDVPSVWTVFRQGGHSLIPIGILICLLIIGFTPTYAAGISILSVIAASWLSKEPMGLKAIIEALELGARNMVNTGLLLIAVGLVVGVIATTGIGNTMSLMIGEWAGGSLLLTLVLVALASLILGKGLPVTAAYIVLGTLSAPALYALISEQNVVELMVNGSLPAGAQGFFLLADPTVADKLTGPMAYDEAIRLMASLPSELVLQMTEQALTPEMLTVALLSAHMIIFWLSQDSNVTPPVCLTAFAAAGIAGTPPMATGVMAWKIAKGLYIVPILFAYTPFLSGDLVQTLWIFAYGTLGIYALTGALAGHLEAPLRPWERLVAAFVGFALIWPTTAVVNAAVLFTFAVLFTRNLLRSREELLPA